MATLPTSGTDIRFLSDIPFSLDYKETRWFDSKEEQNDYFDRQTVVHTMGETNFQRPENSTFIAVNKPIEQLYDVNYVMFRNSSYGTKWFFGFVVHLEYKNRVTTHVHIQLDVLQTWLFRLNFKPSFIVREHCKLWNDDGTPVINTVDEGLNYGLEYDIVEAERHRPFGMVQFMVIVSKTPMDDGDDIVTENSIKPHYDATPQSLTMYVIPFDLRKKEVALKLKGDTSGKILPIEKPLDALQKLYKNEDATNNIVSIYVTPNVGYDFEALDLYPDDKAFPMYLEYEQDGYFGFKSVKIKNDADGGGGAASDVSVLRVTDRLSYSTIRRRVMDDKYSGFKPVKESKLLMYPYTNLVIDDFKGNRHAYKLEYIRDPFISVLYKGATGVDSFHSVAIDGYNSEVMAVDPITEFTSNDHAVIDNQPNDVSVINDYLTAFLQGNKNQIKNQTDSIQFNGIMNGLRAVSDAATSSAHLLSPPTNPFNAIENKISAGSGLANAAIDGVQGAGNTVLQLQAIEAKQADIANVPPSISKMGTNTAYNSGNNYGSFYFIKKQIKSEYIQKLTDFFNAYGYKVNRLKIPNLHTRRYWNYIQTIDINITGNLNFADLEQIKQVFNNGITLWHTDDIGNYSLENEVL